jgi:hypothetical protein
MSHLEDQANELEALASIYSTSFRAGGSSDSFSLLLEPELDGGPGTNHVAAWLHASYPPSYPDEPLSARLEAERGLSEEQLAQMRVEMSAAVAVRVEASCVQSGVGCCFEQRSVVRS